MWQLYFHSEALYNFKSNWYIFAINKTETNIIQKYVIFALNQKLINNTEGNTKKKGYVFLNSLPINVEAPENFNQYFKIRNSD